jgi:hypothetical protein
LAVEQEAGFIPLRNKKLDAIFVYQMEETMPPQRGFKERNTISIGRIR